MQFNAAAGGLRDYELMLIKSLAEMEKIELQTGQVKETYTENFKELSDVEVQQNALISELSAIEDELDAMLPQRMNQQTGNDNKFLAQVMRNPDMYDNVPNREQVF